jgi:hypothetical protein
MEKKMKPVKTFVFSVLFMLMVFSAYSQSQDDSSQDQGVIEDFLLIPILETVFSKQVNWHPGWPEFLPPDGFSVLLSGNRPKVIELSSEDETFVVRRDSEGNLLEFPFFYSGGYGDVETVYKDGAPSTMKITLIPFSSGDESSGDSATANSSGDKSAGNSASGGTDSSDVVDVIFPAGFKPYSELSPGGAFPPITVNYNGSTFYVYIFETPQFLTETWYDEQANMLVYCKVVTNVDRGSWRIVSMQVREDEDTRITEYFYNAYGNVAAFMFEQKLLSRAVYKGNAPVYWQCNNLEYNFQWDTRDSLVNVNVKDENGGFLNEYRYDYEFDDLGNWTKRLETAYIIQYDLLTPNPLYSRGFWNRRITY